MSYDPLSTSDALLTFGYHPDYERIDLPTGRARFRRTLLPDAAASNLCGRIDRFRARLKPEVTLAERISWLDGITEPADPATDGVTLRMTLPVARPGISRHSATLAVPPFFPFDIPRAHQHLRPAREFRVGAFAYGAKHVN